jgi:hypothetical protein
MKVGSMGVAAASLSDEANAVREKVNKARVTLDTSKQLVQDILNAMIEKSMLEIDYVTPKSEPVLSIQAKKGTLLEALEYLALCGNFSLNFTDTKLRIGPNFLPEIPANSPQCARRRSDKVNQSRII